MYNYLQWPLRPPRTPGHLVEFEKVHETLDLYLWLGMRFPEQFVAREAAMSMQNEIESAISRYLARQHRISGAKWKLHDWNESHGDGGPWGGEATSEQLGGLGHPSNENMVKMAERLLRNAVDLQKKTGTLGRELIK